MLDVSPKNLLAELRVSEEHCKRFTASLPDRIERYHGPNYKGQNSGPRHIDNHALRWMQQVGSGLVADNPAVQLTSPLEEWAEDVGALEAGANRWIDQSRLYRLLDREVADYGFGPHAVLMVTQAPIPGWDHDDPPHWPQMTRVPPDRFGWDPAATAWEDSRFFWHRWAADLDDLKKRAEKKPEEGWNADVLADMTADTGLQDLKRDDTANVPSRREIVATDFWVPEFELPFPPTDAKLRAEVGDAKSWREAGFNGTVFTLASGAKRADFLRAPRPYYGPRWGMYSMGCALPVPGHVAGLGPLCASQHNIDSRNAFKEAYHRAARLYKRMVIVGGSDAELVDDINETDDLALATKAALDVANVLALEVGGITAQHQVLDTAMERELDRDTGLSGANRGQVSGVGTATENAIADAAYARQMHGMERRFRDFIEQAIATVIWYLFEDDRSIFPLGREQKGALFLGGRDKRKAGERAKRLGYDGEAIDAGLDEREEKMAGARRLRFDDLEVRIELYSMSRVDELGMATAQAAAAQYVLATLPLIPQTAFYYDWQKDYEEFGRVHRIPGFAKRLDMKAAYALGLHALQMEAQPEAQGGSEQASPTRLRRVGGAGLQSQGAAQPEALPSGVERQTPVGPRAAQKAGA